MFYGCSSLTSLNLSNNVNNMSYMFYYCSSLTSLNLSNSNNVNNINHMLYYCSSLTCLNLSNFNNVKYMNDNYVQEHPPLLFCQSLQLQLLLF